MYVEKPHPYGFLQAIFEDTKLKDASGAPLNPNYGSRTANANTNYYYSSSENKRSIDAPLGNVDDRTMYDRFQHSYLFTYGNKLFLDGNNTASVYRLYSDRSYSDTV